MGRGKKGKTAMTNANDAKKDDVVARDDENVVIARDDDNVEIIMDETAQSGAMSEDETGFDAGYADNETDEGPVKVSDDSNNTAS
jgi:hypothetical protein